MPKQIPISSQLGHRKERVPLKLGVLVGDKGNWTFFDEIYSDLNRHFETDVHRERTFNTPLLYGRLNRWAYRHDIRSMLRRNEVCLFEWATDLLAAASHMKKTCPIVTRLHSYELYAWAPKINWDRVDRVILVGEEMRRKFCDLYPEYASRTRVVNNGVSLDKFQPPPDRNFRMRLGMLASIHPAKRIYEVIMTQVSLRERGYAPRLHVAGKRLHGGYVDEYFAAITSLVEKLGLDGDYSYDGFVTDTARWLREVDIYISNSYWEGQQVALLEAMACGCYCLSHCWDGVDEVLPQENVYITERELEAKIIEYAELPETERRRRQARMREIARQRFDIRRTQREIREVIDEVAKTATA